MLKRKLSRLQWPVFLVLMAAMLASAQDSKQQQAPATGGVLVFIDPVTGAIRPPEQGEVQALMPPAGASFTALQPLTHSSGASGMLLGDDYMSYSVATIGADGKVKIQHADGKANAEAIVGESSSRKEPSDVR
jgi:hypothetical protein